MMSTFYLAETEVVKDVMAGKLTERQKRFIDFYIETGNATEAARKAGYKKPNPQGSENLAKPSIKAAIDARLKEIEDARVADAREVMRFLTSALRGEIKEEVVVVEGLGEGGGSAATIVKKQISAHDRLDAAKQLAKRYSLEDKEFLDLQKEKLKAEIIKIRAGTKEDIGTEYQDDGLLEALNKKAEDVWK